MLKLFKNQLSYTRMLNRDSPTHMPDQMSQVMMKLPLNKMMVKCTDQWSEMKTNGEAMCSKVPSLKQLEERYYQKEMLEKKDYGDAIICQTLIKKSLILPQLLVKRLLDKKTKKFMLKTDMQRRCTAILNINQPKKEMALL